MLFLSFPKNFLRTKRGLSAHAGRGGQDFLVRFVAFVLIEKVAPIIAIIGGMRVQG